MRTRGAGQRVLDNLLRPARIVAAVRLRPCVRHLILTFVGAFTLSVPALGRAETLVIVSPHWEGIQEEFGRGFVAHYRAETGQEADVEWLNQGGTSDILRFLRSEYRRTPEGIGIDLLFGGGIDPFLELQRDGLLAAYRVPDSLLASMGKDIGGIPVYDPQFHWYGATLGGFGIVYNHKVLEWLKLEPPQTWTDLTAPGLRSWVGTGDPRSSGSVHMACEILLQALGWRDGWGTLVRLGGNVKTFSQGSSQPVRDVATGDLACALSIDFYAWAEAEEFGHDIVGYVMPDGMTVINPDGIAILKGASNRELAQAFIRFVLSEQGQRLWVTNRGSPGGPKAFQLGRFTVWPALYAALGDDAAVPLNPFKMESSLRYDSAKGSRRWRLVNDLIGAAIIDSHKELAGAWKAIIEAGLPEEAVAKLIEPPMTEPEALELADAVMADSERRNVLIVKWTIDARARYGAAKKLALAGR